MTLSVAKLHVTVPREGHVPVFLQDVTVEVKDGQLVGLVGESGAGKSLLLASVLGLLDSPARVVSGAVTLDGSDLLRLSEGELAAVRGQQVGFIGPNPHTLLNPLVTVGHQVVRLLRAHQRIGKAEARDRVLEMFRSVGIPDPVRRFDSYPHELSGGMAQRVVVSAGLISEPRVLLADEPTFGLDVTIQAQVLELISDQIAATAGRSMLLVTRDLGIVANYCDWIYMLRDGRLVESQPVPDFFAEPRSSYGRALLDAVTLAQAGGLSG